MFEREAKLYAFMLNYTKDLMADLDDARLAEQPLPGMNHPAWILGHLAIATDYTLKLSGQEPRCPEAWHTQFGPGSVPSTDRTAYPSKAAFMEALISGHAAATEAATHIDPKRLDQPHGIPMEFLNAIPTVGELLAHLMTTHEATHVGQLSAWRRAMQLPSIL